MVVAKFSISNLTNAFFLCFSSKCILSLELLINILCSFFLFLAFRFQASHLLCKAFSVLTGNHRCFFNVSLIGRAILPIPLFYFQCPNRTNPDFYSFVCIALTLSSYLWLYCYNPDSFYQYLYICSFSYGQSG